MRTTNIADLRNKLTRYLKEVQAGEEIVIRDRLRPIAKIVPFSAHEDDSDLVAAGLIRPGTRRLPTSFWKRSGTTVPLDAIVDAVRADRVEG